jgi:hypothetical protein
MQASIASGSKNSFGSKASRWSIQQTSHRRRASHKAEGSSCCPARHKAETVATLVHEVAHEKLHRADRRTCTTKRVRETEAEAVAFVVCQAIDLETGTASAQW